MSNIKEPPCPECGQPYTVAALEAALRSILVADDAMLAFLISHSSDESEWNSRHYELSQEKKAAYANARALLCPGHEYVAMDDKGHYCKLCGHET